MEKNDTVTFDMPSLLRTRVLNIKELAANNAALTSGEYFEHIRQFNERMPKLLYDLSQMISGGGANKKTLLQYLFEIRTLLGNISCSTYHSDIRRLDDAIKSDEPDLMRAGAAELLNSLYFLYRRTEAAQNRDESTNVIKRRAAIPLCELLAATKKEDALRKLRILAVDDVSILLRLISETLGKYYEVFTLTSGAQVENFLLHTTPELFLLDIVMPDISGYDLIPIIRQFDEHKDTPIIFITGNATEKHLKKAIALGVNDFISKPINSSILLEKVEKQIIRKKLF